jgi:hypothetical protein
VLQKQLPVKRLEGRRSLGASAWTHGQTPPKLLSYPAIAEARGGKQEPNNRFQHLRREFLGGLRILILKGSGGLMGICNELGQFRSADVIEAAEAVLDDGGLMIDWPG